MWERYFRIAGNLSNHQQPNQTKQIPWGHSRCKYRVQLVRTFFSHTTQGQPDNRVWLRHNSTRLESHWTWWHKEQGLLSHWTHGKLATCRQDLVGEYQLTIATLYTNIKRCNPSFVTTSWGTGLLPENRCAFNWPCNSVMERCTLK